ncbi:MAG: SIMPL domain-containing protein, partial [Clostridium sp.]
MYQQLYSEVFPSNNNYNYDGMGGNNNKLKVFGSGVVNAKPDKAEIEIGVITEDKQLKLAQKENAKITQQVIESIQNMGVLEKDIQTKNYNIRSKYDYIDGKQIFKGYEVSNILKVVVENINDVGKIIDTAVKNGANTVDNISFIVSDRAKYYNEALKLAIDDAQNKALAIGNKLKVKVDIVPIQIVEQGVGRDNSLEMLTFKSSNASTPIEPGENKISAAIDAIFI